MTHNQIVAALQRGYQLEDARASRRGCYPIRKAAPPTTVTRTLDDPLPSDTPDPTGFGEEAASSEAMTDRGPNARHVVEAPRRQLRSGGDEL
jgi:hypothetical protein